MYGTHPPRIVLDAFHGKIPRFFWRMWFAHPHAWGQASRAPREAVQAVLRSVGLEMRLATKEERNKARRPGARRGPAYSYQKGELVQAA